jgi:uncharacterized protein Smg (DUF494 family)
MKDQLFEMLLSLFEQTLTQLKSQQQQLDDLDNHLISIDKDSITLPIFHAQSDKGTRVITILEQAKLTKPALQFLMRLLHTEVLSSAQFEQVMNLVLDSNMRFVSVEEIKYIAHQVLSDSLSDRELMMLEFSFNAETTRTTMH